MTTWETAGAYTVADGVHRIPLPLPGDALRAVNVYAFTGGDEVVLVDAGWAMVAAEQALSAALAGLGVELGDVRRVLVTHVHRDHYTLALRLRARFGTRVALGAHERATLDVVLDPADSPWRRWRPLLEQAGAADVAARAAAAFGEDSAGQDWSYPDDWLTAAAVVPAGGRQLTVVATPGHTRGHLAFADLAGGLLFAGDHVLPHITPSIGFEAARPDLPLADFLASLRRVRGLPDLRLLPAHGQVADSVHARVDELVTHHQRRLDACAAVVGRGLATAYDVARALPWTRRDRQFDDLDVFNQLLAVLETAAHLDVLVTQERARVKDEDGVRRYEEPG